MICCSSLQIESLLGVKLADVFKGKVSPLRVLDVCRDDGYQLRNRALHVYIEAARVVKFKEVCDVSNSFPLCLRWQDLSHYEAKAAACSSGRPLHARAKQSGAQGVSKLDPSSRTL